MSKLKPASLPFHAHPRVLPIARNFVSFHLDIITSTAKSHLSVIMHIIFQNLTIFHNAYSNAMIPSYFVIFYDPSATRILIANSTELRWNRVFFDYHILHRNPGSRSKTRSD